MNRIERVGVIGAGLMGSGIIEVSARAGLDVIGIEITDDAAEAATHRVERSLRKAEERGRITTSEADDARERIRFESDLQALADRDLVIESASENEATKLDLFRRLGTIVSSSDAVLASNTSSIPIGKLGAASGRGDHVLGVHFFLPATMMQLVELIPSMSTSRETLDRLRSWVEQTLGKTAIEAPDRAGFVVNALLVPYVLSAIRMYESGYASAENIDRGMELGCGHPIGPLALADLAGLDTIKAIGESLYAEFKEPLYSPPPLLDRMLEAGLTGRKSGRGFYTYSTSP